LLLPLFFSAHPDGALINRGFEMASPFDNEILRKWFVESLPAPPCEDLTVSTLGSGPLSEADFDDMLAARGLMVYSLHQETEVLIVGHDGWEPESLQFLLDEREEMSLKVYSQEMFLSHWLSGRDPFDDREIAEAFGKGHSALQFLSECGFDWPSTFITSGGGDLNIKAPTVGILRYLGHRVGESGLPSHSRQEVLEHAFTSKLPLINSVSYMREWGNPRSKERLRKIANSLAAFCQLQKRRGNAIAASDYEEDLEWLRRRFYSGRFSFKWPSTYVR
jgi:hypothetical protein